MHPATSYWPPTTSPGCSFGVNENGVPHLGQKPSARPARPPRDRPTFSPHLEQKRLSSGTSGLAMSTDCGSGTGADGTVVMPAPRCWIRDVALTSRRVGRLRPARAEPMGELDSLVESACFLPLGVPVGVDTAVTGAEAGIPHTLQYPSSI